MKPGVTERGRLAFEPVSAETQPVSGHSLTQISDIENSASRDSPRDSRPDFWRAHHCCRGWNGPTRALSVERRHRRLGQPVGVELAGMGKLDNPNRHKLDDGKCLGI